MYYFLEFRVVLVIITWPLCPRRLYNGRRGRKLPITSNSFLESSSMLFFFFFSEVVNSYLVDRRRRHPRRSRSVRLSLAHLRRPIWSPGASLLIFYTHRNYYWLFVLTFVLCVYFYTHTSVDFGMERGR